MNHTSDAVLHSRAGDRFHYLWAARRCLRMIHPMSPVESITVEGSPEPDRAGEQVIDVSEVRRVDNTLEAHYYQLKHSSARLHKPMVLSELSKTLQGFAARFKERKLSGSGGFEKRFFWVISNRAVSDSVKNTVRLLAQGKALKTPMRRKFLNTTKLNLKELQAFCSVISFSDDEGNYIEQEHELRDELARYEAGTVERSAILELSGLVADQALPNRRGRRHRGLILREHVLKVLGVSHAEDLFPAPLAMEPVANLFLREQHEDIVKSLINAPSHMIIHAAGGVGKSVVARQLSLSLPEGSTGIVYDCFGGGTYLNPSRPRHRHCDAIMQIINELATDGLCQTIIVRPHIPSSQIIRSFLRRIGEASEKIQGKGTDALLVILVDAADNAEMAAAATGDECFVSKLIREELPKNCRIVYLCRTERRDMLKPTSKTGHFELLPFSLAETAKHLAKRFDEASPDEAREFHRLTGGNPRVQATCLAFAEQSVREMLNGLGPGRVTVDQQIGNQLQAAIGKLKDQNPEMQAASIDAICRGLATLPPFIPIPVIAAAAGVKPEAVKSLIADLGRPLWCSDDSVQFRDEPTETWFKARYAASQNDLIDYASALESLAPKYTYAAQCLPAIWLQAGEYDKLIQLALSDEYLPDNNPIDAREVRIHRLQYALKAALKIKRYHDAAKLALRAGEEMAGNRRQLQLFRDNIDLLSLLQAPAIVQEWAYKRQLYGGWRGSENIYAASLLSMHRDFHGEARNYLYSSNHWTHIYFEEREKQKTEEDFVRDSLQTDHIAEMGWAHLGLDGPRGFVTFVSGWTPPQVVYDVTCHVVRRMVDSGRFDEIEEIVKQGATCVPIVLGACLELEKVSKFPMGISLRYSLDALSEGKFVFQKQSYHSWQDTNLSALIAFAEACVFRKLDSSKVITVLESGLSVTTSAYDLASDYDKASRHVYARSLALKHAIERTSVPNSTDIFPEPSADLKSTTHERENRSMACRILDELLPLYSIRAQIVAQNTGWEDLSFRSARKLNVKSNDYGYPSEDRFNIFRDELPVQWLRIAVLQRVLPEEDMVILRGYLNSEKSQRVGYCIEMTRIGYCYPRFVEFGSSAESASYSLIEAAKSPEPDERVSSLTSLSRAVLSRSREDAAAYFEKAIEEVSKFGDELVERWSAMTDLARVSAEVADPALTYRYFRCAELVGNTVAREKYWDREDVFRVMLRMHPSSSLAAWSRWRDREIGWAEDLLEALATDYLELGESNSTAIFCLSGFLGVHGSVSFITGCLKHEKDLKLRQKMFDQSVIDIYRNGKLLEEENKLTDLCSKHGIDPSILERNCVEARRRKISPTKNHQDPTPILTENQKSDDAEIAYKALIKDIDLGTSSGIVRAKSHFESLAAPRYAEVFWKGLLDCVPIDGEVRFIQAVLEAESLHAYDIYEAITQIGSRWGAKASVRRFWPSFLRSVGKRLHVNLAERGGVSYLIQRCGLQPTDLPMLKVGMFEGIESCPELLHSNTLFGFVSVVASHCEPLEAKEVLMYAFERIEVHYSDDFGDGCWGDWLLPPEHVVDAYTGLIWASLGAPDASIRWQAAHCVRRLAEFRCQNEVASLLGWVGRNGINSFLGKDCPFYHLHATLFLLIGLARGCLEDASILIPHHELLTRLAVASVPHALIQPIAAQLVLKIEQIQTGTFDPATVAMLQNIGKSPFAELVLDRDQKIRSAWHADPMKAWPTKPYFGMDIDAYWIPRLSRVFQIPPKDLDELMKEVALSYLPTPDDNGYLRDPRDPIWREHRYDDGRSTYHSHGSSPRVERLDFYVSFQALMIAAAKLRQAMPVVKQKGDGFEGPDSWSYWISSYSLLRKDGRWLSDRRDPTLPSRKPNVSYDQYQNWRYQIEARDFFDILTNQASVLNGLCIYGDWSDAQDSRREQISVNSALVSPEMASSLACAFRYADNSDYASLSGLMAERESPNSPPFDTLPLVLDTRRQDDALEKFDPYLRGMSYPPTTLHPSIVKRFDLSSDAEERYWSCQNFDSPIAVCEAWQNKGAYREDLPTSHGERVMVSSAFLKNICKTFDRWVVITVQIRRHDREDGDQEISSYAIPPSCKAFIFDSHGRLLDAKTHYQLG